MSSPSLRLTQRQDAFVRSPSTLLLYRGGIASGKTIAGCVRTIVRRYLYPGTVQIIGGPSWDQLRDGTMRTMRRLIDPRCIVYEHGTEHRWVLDNGSELIWRTLADPNVLRGVESHDVYIDEIASCSQEALDVALGRARLPYADADVANCTWGTTTPRGIDWTLDVWGWEGTPSAEVVHSTIYDNRANLPDGYIERLEERYRDTPFFEQELLGRYTAFEGLVYPMFLPDRHLRPAVVPLTACESVAVGMDFGGTADPSAMLLVGESGGRQHVYAEWRRTGAILADMLETLAVWTRDAGRAPRQMLVRPDPSGTVMVSTLAAAGYDCVGAARDKLAGIQIVAERLTGSGGIPQLTVEPDCAYLRQEMGQYIWRKRRGETGVIHLTHEPIDHHADLLDCLRYAVMALGQHRPLHTVTLPSGRRVVGYGTDRAADARPSPLDRRLPQPTGTP